MLLVITYEILPSAQGNNHSDGNSQNKYTNKRGRKLRYNSCTHNSDIMYTWVMAYFDAGFIACMVVNDCKVCHHSSIKSYCIRTFKRPAYRKHDYTYIIIFARYFE